MLNLRRLSVAVITSLILSLVGNLPSLAYDPGPITKTVAVSNSFGANYGAGAEVALVFRDSLNDISTSPVVLTNQSGEAQFQVRATDEYIGIAIAPSASDSVHGLEFLNAGFDSFEEQQISFVSWAQTFEVQLKQANVFVTPLVGRTGFDLAPAGTRLAVLTSNGFASRDFVLPRPGKVGVFVGEDVDYANVGLRPAKKSGSQSFVPMNFSNGWVQTTSSHVVVNGGIAIRLFPSNLFGSLRSHTGSPISLPNDVTANIRFVTADPASGRALVLSSTLRIGSEVLANGSFEAFVPRLVVSLSSPIAVVPQVFFTGSQQYPSFIGAPVWINPDGEFSSTSDFASTSATLQVRMPEVGSANVSFESLRLSTSISEPARLEVRRTDGNFEWWGSLLSLNGQFAYRLPIGNYSVDLTPRDSLRPSAHYDLVVSESGSTLSRFEDIGFGQVANLGSPQNARYQIFGALNNDVNLVVVDPSTGASISHELVEANVNFAPAPNNRNWRWFNRGAKGIVAVDLPEPGTYEAAEAVNLTIQPKSWMDGVDPLWTNKDYRFDLSGSTPRLFSGNTEIVKLATPGTPTFVVKLGYANVYGNLVGASGQSISYESEQWINAQVQRFIPDQNRWDYHRWITVTTQGRFGAELPNGTYRISFEPNGFDGEAKTVTPQFTISNAEPTKVFTNFQLAAPRISIEIVAPGSTSALPNTSLQLISRSANIYEWLWIGPNGRANLSPENGEYELQVNPPQNVAVVATKKTYRLVVSANSIAVYDGNSLVTAVSNSPPTYKLSLASPNLSGTVVAPNGASMRHVQVVPVDRQTGRELWDLSANTDVRGNWFLNLPEGSYDIYARAPWGSSEFGNSAPISGVQVNANGQVVANSLPQTISPTAIELRLRYPLWSGVVVDPMDGVPMTNAEVCLFGPSAGVCSATNTVGAWALSRPIGMTGFSGWTLVVRERGDARYTEKRFEGSEINQVMSFSADANAAFRDIRLSVQVPNVRIRVMAGSTPVANSYVSLDRPGSWLGGAHTDADGYAKLNITNPEERFFAQANVGHIRSLDGVFTSTRTEFILNSSNASGGVYTSTIDLKTANFKATALEAVGSSVISQGWASLVGPDNRWIANSDWNSSGNFSFAIPTESETVTYRIEINPRGSQGSSHVRTNFEVEITPQGAITVNYKGQAQGVANTRFQLRLATPNVRGKVVNTSSNGVRDSFVVPIDTATNWHQWQLGTNSSDNGNFSMNLEDGIYKLEASVPWYLSGLAKSAKCTIVVSGSTTAVADQHCIDSNSDLVLRLREPNLKFKLTTPDGTAVPYANVGIGIADYNVNAQSDREGYVSLFLDQEEMKEAADKFLTRNWISDQSTSPGIQLSLRVWVDPPWGNNTIVRWDCSSGQQKPICRDLPMLSKVNGSWENWTAPGLLSDVAFPGPNTRVQVMLPGGQTPVAEGAWVSVFKERTEVWGTWREWVGGSNTNRDGISSFLIEDGDQSATFSVEVNAPWHLRSTYPSKIYSGLRLNTSATPVFNFGRVFELPTKNLTVTVRQSAGDKPAKWSWISVEKFESGTYSWLNGSGTDELGRSSFRLEPDSNVQYKLTVHPGPGSEGTMLTCFIATNGSQLINSTTAPSGFSGCGNIVSGQLTLTLSSGNTRGTVVDSASAVVAGAIVLAQSGTEFKSAVTNARGEFFMQLDNTKTWIVKVLYANPVDADPYRQRVDVSASTATTRDDALTITFDGPNNSAVLQRGGNTLTNNAITMHRVSEN